MITYILHHIMGRGIERKKIFISDKDRDDFIARLCAMAVEGTKEAGCGFSIFSMHSELPAQKSANMIY